MDSIVYDNLLVYIKTLEDRIKDLEELTKHLRPN